MTAPADLVLTNARVHTLTEPDESHEAVAIRDGDIVRVDCEYEVEFLVGVETTVIDCEDRVVLPGFVDAHTHMQQLGQYQLHADLSGATSPDHAVDILADDGHPDREWLLGFGWDESGWDDDRYLTREDLDEVSEDRPVAAIRVDMHTAALNSAALDLLRDELAAHDEDVQTEGGEPTGVVVEDALDPIWTATEPDPAETRELLDAAQQYAVERGVTGVHDMVRQSHAPRVYRDMELDGDLDIRVRINYWSDHLDAVSEAGLRTNHGSDRVEMGAIKTFTDGSFGGRTAKLSEPYVDAESAGDADTGEDEPGDGTGTWVVDPDELHALSQEVDDLGLQLTVHAIGDEAIGATLDAFEATENPGAARHRVEHVELVTDEHIERFAETGIVASCQPNFLQWAQEDGLYDRRLGRERRTQTNRFRDLLDAGVNLAFSSDVMPMDPLLGVHHAVNAPAESQRLTVTEALRAYTLGGAYAGFDEDRLGTLEEGKQADIVVLDESPWEHEDSIRDVDVAMTVVGGDVVFDGR
ncbi:amidohydrolase [Haloarchaeobius sp. TZWWS8]|uniref:amidohydrolase n=1 Tax=Haloarchaeobius sp. TZWWS8 TaxID=3446121 RepID=UPI003EB96CA1